MSLHELLDIVNENDEVIGQAIRKDVHEKGLLHRVADIWFYNKKGEVIFQKRSLTKDTSPGLYGFSVGGHVGAGYHPHEVAVKEIFEEAGLIVEMKDVHFINNFVVETFDPKVNQLICDMKHIFAHCFEGDIADLTVEEGEIEGFEWWSIEKILQADDELKQLFSTGIFHEEVLKTLQKVLELSQQ